MFRLFIHKARGLACRCLRAARDPHASHEDLHAVLMTMARTGITDFFVGDLDWVLCSIIVHVCLV